MSKSTEETYDQNESLPKGIGDEFLVSYARQRVTELRTYHEEEGKKALSSGDFTIYAYHQGALGILASFAGLLAPRPARATEEVA